MIDLIILSMFAMSFVIMFYGLFKYADDPESDESEDKMAKILLVALACSSLAGIMGIILAFTR